MQSDECHRGYEFITADDHVYNQMTEMHLSGTTPKYQHTYQFIDATYYTHEHHCDREDEVNYQDYI